MKQQVNSLQLRGGARPTGGLRARSARRNQLVVAALNSRLDPNAPNVVNMKVDHNIESKVSWVSPDAGCRLSDYMTLPPEQFVLVDLPVGARMDRIDNQGTFKLIIPRLEILNLWLEPSFEVLVQLKEVNGRPCVALKSGEVDVRGPAWIDNVQDRIFFFGETQLSWEEGRDGGKIISKTHIEARADPPSPISMLPKQAIATAVETVIAGMVTVLQRPFVDQIIADYKKWASDPAYRAKRRELSEQAANTAMVSAKSM